jgi:hypothetical protein
MNNFCFDIETSPLDSETLSLIIPPFNEEDVKTGNMGADKRAEKIAKARTDHERNFYRRAALSAVTGKVVAIGIIGPSEIEKQLMIDPDEKLLIREFFDFFSQSVAWAGSHWFGFNITLFDLPFLIRRAWALQIPIPNGITEGGRYLSNWFTDLMDIWRGTDFRGEMISLSDLAVFLGLPAKQGSGAQFSELLRYEPDKARAYLENDLWLTWQVADRLGVMRKATPQRKVVADSKTDSKPKPLIRFW